MKEIGFLLFLMMNLSLSVFSQRFNAGLLAGGLVSQVDGDQNAGFHKFGFLAGGLVNLKISRHSSLQMELEYIQKGSRGTDTINRTDFLLRFHYIEVPFLYQLTFKKRFSFEIGPAMDVSIGSLEERDGMETPEIWQMRPLTLSGIFGFSGFISSHLKANLRFNYSLLSIRSFPIPYNASSRYILFEPGQYNNVLSLSLLWYFKANDF